MKKIESVLLIDDDPICNFLHATLLKKNDITGHIQISINGHEALTYINAVSKLNNCPDLIFLDINMPVMNGHEFLHEYCEGNYCERQPIIIILTTSSNNNDISKLKEYPCVSGYLSKPLTTEKFNSIFKMYFS
jgi:response regulator of citrate/malate metabolism